MDDAIELAIEEIKRVDHLIYVSLKYTRTVDVFKNIFERLINTYDKIFDGILNKLLKEEKIKELPESVIEKCNLLKENFKDDIFTDYVNFYLMLRKLNKAEYTRSNEFRKHVTMTATLDSGQVMEVKITTIHEYFEKTKAFIHYIRELYGETIND